MSKKYDFENMKKTFFREAKCIEFEVINFEMASSWELENLPHDKSIHTKYTATFFCRKLNECFLYKVIFSIENMNTLADGNIKKRLEIGARTIYQMKKRTKNPFKYLKDINLNLTQQSIDKE